MGGILRRNKFEITSAEPSIIPGEMEILRDGAEMVSYILIAMIKKVIRSMILLSR